MLTGKCKFAIRSLMVFALCLAILTAQASAQFVVRIGVIDREDGASARGAILAAKHINERGGLLGANRTAFELKIVVTPPYNPEIAAANMKQADVIAVIGPGNDSQMLALMQPLTSLDVPAFISSSSDSLLLQNAGQNIFRSAANDSVLARALASYLVADLDLRTVTTIQLDAASTSSLIAFATALAELGIGASNLFLDDAQTDFASIVGQILDEWPDAVSIYGPPLRAAQVHSQLRGSGYKGIVTYDQAADPGFVSFVSPDLLPGIVSATNWSFSSGDEMSRQFVLDYVATFGAVPDAESAASYDAIGLLAEAFRRPGNLSDNLSRIDEFAGVQGVLTPARLANGETSSNAAITRLNEFGVANVVARAQGGESVSTAARAPIFGTPTPVTTATPPGYNLTVLSAFQNVRSGPGLNYDVIGQLPSGTQARVRGATTDYAWFVIDFQGQLGWLAAYLVDTFGDRSLVPLLEPPASPTPSITALPQSEPDIVIVNAYPNRITLDQLTLVNVIVENLGLSAAGPFTIAASFQPGNRFASSNLPGLSAGRQATVQLQLNPVGSTGPQSAIVVADFNQQVYEGPVGEANNQIHAFNYILDRPIISSGARTVNEGSVDLDGAGDLDLAWTGDELLAVNGGGLYLISEFSALDDVHHDAINPELATADALNAGLLRDAIVGVITSAGRRGALQVTNSSREGPITFSYRVYR